MSGSGVDAECEEACDVASDEYAEFDDEEGEEEERVEVSEQEEEEVVLGGRSRKKRRFQFHDEDPDRVDRDMHVLQDACLPVSGAPMPPGDGPPKDADEYLRQVQWERLHCPETVDVDVEEKPPRKDHPRRRQRDGGLLARVNLSEAGIEQKVPFSTEWASDAIAAFLGLRAAFDGERGETPGAGSARLTLPQWRKYVGENRPSSDVLAQQNFTSIHRLVTVSVEMLREAEASVASASRPPSGETAEKSPAAPDGAGAREGGAASDAAAAAADGAAGAAAAPAPAAPPDAKEGFRRLDHISEWAFAALTALELPLVDDVQFQLQRLRRTCHKLLALGQALVAEDVCDEDGGEGSARSALVARASVLVIITMDVFGQR